MSLLEEARAQQHTAGGTCMISEHLPDPDLEEALEAVRNKLLNRPGPRLDGSALERALTKRDKENPLKSDTIRRHAKGECSCVAAV